MVEWVERLLELQNVDTRIIRLEQQLRSVPAEIDAVRQQEADAEHICADARKKVQDCQKGIKDIETRVGSVQSKMRDFQQKSNMIKDNKEYRAAMEQIEACKRQISQLEDDELEIMERLEEAKQELASQQKEAEAAKARAQETVGDLEKRAENSRKQLEKLRNRRATLLPDMPAPYLNKYERIRRSGRFQESGRVLVPVQDYNCDYCHMNVTAQARMDARKGQLVTCENCGAMLYAED